MPAAEKIDIDSMEYYRTFLKLSDLKIMTLKARNISGVILAGGENKRFAGVNKSNLIIEGASIISRIVNIISESSLK